VGKGKLTKFRELDTFEHVIQAPYRVVNNKNHKLKGGWDPLFFKNSNPLILELGCGKGEYTLQMAEKYPENNYIGVDIKGARMWKGARESWVKGLKNTGFIRTHIELTEHFFAPGEVSEIWLTFPDPQMKKFKKRLTSSRFISIYSHFLAPDGIIHLKTDSHFLFHYTLAMAKVNGFRVVAQTEDLYRSGRINDILQIKTFYENQWLLRGIAIKYLAFKIHNNEPFVEPVVDIEKDTYRSFGRHAVNKKQNE